MKRSEALTCYLALLAALPGATINEGTQEFYVRKLLPLDKDLCARAIDKLTDSWSSPSRLPTVGNIKTVYAELELADRRRSELETQRREEALALRLGPNPSRLLNAEAEDLEKLKRHIERVGQSMPEMRRSLDAADAVSQWGDRTPRTAEELEAAIEESRRRM